MPKENKDLQEKVKKLKGEGWFIKSSKTKSFLIHPESGTETSIEDMFPSNERSYAFSSFEKITKDVFLPSRPRLIPCADLQGFYELNTWKNYIPKTDEREQGIACWIEFLERLFPIENERKYVVQFLAHLMQKPEERPSFAIMLTSDQGTGKGVLFSHILYPLLSKQAVQNSDYSAFMGKHSNSLDGTLLCMLDDTQSNHPVMMTKLKSRISEPYVHIERKFENARTIPVFTRIILASNKITPIQLSENDTRRWYVPSYIRHKIDKPETQAFIANMLEKISLDSIYNWLMNQSLDGFNHKNPPETETLLAMVERSKPELECEIDDFIQTRKVFQWSCLKLFLNENFYDKDIKDYLSEKGYQSKRLNFKSTKITYWYHNETPFTEVKEIAKTYTPYPFDGALA